MKRSYTKFRLQLPSGIKQGEPGIEVPQSHLPQLESNLINLIIRLLKINSGITHPSQFESYRKNESIYLTHTTHFDRTSDAFGLAEGKL